MTTQELLDLLERTGATVTELRARYEAYRKAHPEMDWVEKLEVKRIEVESDDE